MVIGLGEGKVNQSLPSVCFPGKRQAESRAFKNFGPAGLRPTGVIQNYVIPSPGPFQEKAFEDDR